MKSRKGTRGWWLVLGLAAGPGAGCSLRTEIGVAELDGAAGETEVLDAGGRAAQGGRATGSVDAVGGTGTINMSGDGSAAGSMSAGGTAIVDSGNAQGGTRAIGGSGGTGGTGGDGGSNMGEEGQKVMLFDGSPQTFKSWRSRRNGGDNPWIQNDDGTMTVQANTGDIQSKAEFNDVFVHLEYRIPMIAPSPSVRERGNSGVYFKSSYELQILDTYGLPPTTDSCGAISWISVPLVSACNAPEEWNIYEAEFKAQLCNAQGVKTANARFVEVTLNGVVVQQNVEVPSASMAGLPERCEPTGLMLQDHSTAVPVTFRNIWVIPRN